MSTPSPAAVDWVPLWSLTNPITPCARVYHNANQTLNANGNTTIAFNSERFDTDNIHDVASNNTRLTCRTAGKYAIWAHIEIAASGAGAYRQMRIVLNGSTIIALEHGLPSASTTFQKSMSTLWDMQVGDYVEFIIYQDSGVALNVPSTNAWSPEFGMCLVAQQTPASTPQLNIPYGTSLPTSPYDGQEAILVDSLSNPSYQWRFRYNAASTSAYKWEFIGGPPLTNSLHGGTSVASLAAVNTWIQCSGTVTVPRAGEYNLKGRVSILRNGGTDTHNIYVGMMSNTSALIRCHNGYGIDAYAETARVALGANGVVYIAVYMENSGGGAAYDSAVEAIPVRVS